MKNILGRTKVILRLAFFIFLALMIFACRTKQVPQNISTAPALAQDVQPVVVTREIPVTVETIHEQIVTREITRIVEMVVTTTPQGADDNRVVSAYTNSNFRVLSVIEHPSREFSLVIATERMKSICEARGTLNCVNDSICGTLGSSSCYFFKELNSNYGTEETTQFITQWEGVGVIQYDSFQFLDENIVTFETGSCDAYCVTILWSLDLETGKVYQLNRSE